MPIHVRVHHVKQHVIILIILVHHGRQHTGKKSIRDFVDIEVDISRMCDQTDQQHDWVSRTSAIVGIVIGVLAGITVLVIIIVIMMISCKRKRTSMWTVQTLPPSIDRRIAQKSSLSVHYQSILSPVLSDRA